MSGWTDVFLGVIAVTMLVTAIFQVGVLVVIGRLSLRLVRLADRAEQEMKPLFRHLDSVGRDAARAASVAAAQVDRADSVLADVAVRIERTLNVVQHAAGAPARQGAAILAGIRAAMDTLRDSRAKGSRSRGEDETLFI